MNCFIQPVAYPHTPLLAIVENITWLVWNLSLAAVPVFAAYRLNKTMHSGIRILLAVVWLLFVPNSLYMLTDVIHIVGQFGMINKYVDVFLFLWYTITITLGVSCYAWSTEWMMQYVHTHITHNRHMLYAMGIVINVLIGIGIAMGRFARTNSWYVATQPIRVVHDAFSIFTCSYALWFVFAFAVGGMGIFHILYTRMFFHSTTPHHKVKSTRKQRHQSTIISR